jgi:hypothetical protein
MLGYKITIPIDPRSHLEVSDKFHRYAKNLRLYFQEFARHNNVDTSEVPSSSSSSFKRNLFGMFFNWLDNDPKPLLENCPRSILDFDIVQYLTTDDDRAPYVIHIDNHGYLYDLEKQNIKSSDDSEPQQLQDNYRLLTTGSDGWIFVVKYDRLYANYKRTKVFPRYFIIFNDSY